MSTSPSPTRSSTSTSGIPSLSPPGIPELQIASDSGSLGDNATSFNNRSAERALQFQVSGVNEGATVEIFADGVKIGEAVGTGTVLVTTDGSTVVPDGVTAFTARQITSTLSSGFSESA